MKEAFEKIKEQLEERGKEIYREPTVKDSPGCCLIPTGEKDILVSKAIEIVNQVAEEYAKDTKVGSNADRIRSMSDQEMATDLVNIFEELFEDGVPSPEYMKMWLQSEAEW